MGLIPFLSPISLSNRGPMTMEKENWENASMASTMTDIEQVSKLANQLGRTERENEDLKKSLDVSVAELDELRMEKTMSCVMCREELKTARIEHDREQRKMEKRYNEEVDEMENLLFDLQKKMSNGDKSLSGGQFWTFLRREDHDKLVKRDDELDQYNHDLQNRIADIEKQLEETDVQVEQQRQMVTQNKHSTDELIAANDMIDQLQQTLEQTERKVNELTSQTNENDAWEVANQQIQVLQEIIKDANIKLGNQEKELKKERARGDELERKIQSAELQLDVIERTEEDNKEQITLNTTQTSGLKSELANSIEKNDTLELSINLMRTAGNKVKDDLAEAHETVDRLKTENIELQDEKELLITQLEKFSRKQMMGANTDDELEQLKMKHVSLASKYIRLKDRTRQKLSAAKKVLDGERQIADEVEGQLRKTVVIYEQQLDRENAAKTHLENDISRTTEVCLTEVGWSLRLFYFAVTQ